MSDALFDSFKHSLGSLVAVPLVIIALGSEWNWSSEVTPIEVKIVESGSESAATRLPGVWEGFAPEGAPKYEGQALLGSEALEFAFDRKLYSFKLVLQADGSDEYKAYGASDGNSFELLWTAPKVPWDGLRTRTSSVVSVPAGVRGIRLEPVEGDEDYSVSALQLVEFSRFSHRFVIPILIGAWIGLHLLRRWRLGQRIAGSMLRQWETHDPWIAGVLIYVILFQIHPILVFHGLSLLALVAAITLIHGVVRRFGLVRAVVGLGAVSLTVLLILTTFVSLIITRIGAQYQLNVDHRMIPGGEINEDGIRYLGSADLIDDEDYVLVFLGDSFTYGHDVDYEDSYPYMLDAMLSELDCSTRVRIVNFGWVSSSPLLSYRLLRDIGHKYKPDLVVYNLDMTDFHDDLRYEVEFHLHGDGRLPSHLLAGRVLRSLLPWVSSAEDGFVPTPRTAHAYYERVSVLEAEAEVMESRIPSDRFFATNLPLEKSRAAIENGVTRNLAQIHDFSSGTLGAETLLVIAPRAYQYSAEESPFNWEQVHYVALGPFVREPFRYFEEEEASLPYPVFSLLDAFEGSSEFPLYFEDDPHWNRQGNRVAAAAVRDYLLSQGLVPCK